MFCYFPSTTDRKESLNQFKGKVQLNPVDCALEKFKEFSSTNSDFFPHHLESADPKERQVARKIVINFMKHIVKISNSNLVRNANYLMINSSVGRDENLVGMETENKKFKLSY